MYLNWRLRSHCCGSGFVLQLWCGSWSDLFTWVRIRFRLFTLMRIRTRSSSKWCKSATPGLHTLRGSIVSLHFSIGSLPATNLSLYGSRVSLHGSILSLSSWIWSLMRIRVLPLTSMRIQLFTLLRIRIDFPKWCGSRSGSATLNET